tara:strand:- start:303 stop:515 length:213 start_codon:yes stop_codon:yes gene_type:complete
MEKLSLKKGEIKKMISEEIEILEGLGELDLDSMVGEREMEGTIEEKLNEVKVALSILAGKVRSLERDLLS